jgi:hypothetical protein
MRLSRKEIIFLTSGCISALIIFIVGTRAHRTEIAALPDEIVFPIDQPVRELLTRFKPNTCRPDAREGTVSGSIDLETFSSEWLTRVEDDRIWWESEHDRGDTEDDHVMHPSMEDPLRRLLELVLAEKGSLEVHDAYRPKGIHAPRSLHREGRAIDLTCDDLGLERLAILCWSAGFDWVFYERKARKGAHVHCSVRREPNRSDWIMPESE